MTGRSTKPEPSHHTIPASPPADVLAELDAAARALVELEARGGRIALSLDDRAAGLRIALEDRGSVRQLTPTQLFDLLG